MIIPCESCGRKYVEDIDKLCDSCAENENEFSWSELHGTYNENGELEV